MMGVGEVCNREVVFIGRDATLQEAAVLMREHHVGDLVVVEERGGRRLPVGILTDRDLVIEVIAKGIPPTQLTTGDVMSFELVTAREQDRLFDTLRRMRERGVRRVPVVDSDGALAGILTVDDVIELLADELGELSRLIAREQSRERERRR
jgi:CBS domain-containing protein